MFLSKTLLRAVLAGAALCVSALPALAYPGVASVSVNVRSGPGTSFPVVDVLQPGEPVDIAQCQGGWCLVSYSGPEGWVSARYLASDRGSPVRYLAPRRVFVPAPVFAPPVFFSPFIVPFPTIHRPFVRRHFVRRPFVSRPFVNRPFVNRPFFDRPALANRPPIRPFNRDFTVRPANIQPVTPPTVLPGNPGVRPFAQRRFNRDFTGGQNMRPPVTAFRNGGFDGSRDNVRPFRPEGPSMNLNRPSMRFGGQGNFCAVNPQACQRRFGGGFGGGGRSY